MLCNICKIYIYDILHTPLKEGEYVTKKCIWRRILPYLAELSSIVCNLLENLPHKNLYEKLILMDTTNGYLGSTKWDTKEEIEMMKKKKCLRLFHYIMKMEPGLIQPLLSYLDILLESNMFGRNSSIHDYRLWFSQRFLLILKTYEEVHLQHRKLIEADLSEVTHRIIQFEEKKKDWIYD